MISSFFIKRPVLSLVISIIIVLTGLLSMFNLPIEQYPRIVPPQIVVSTNYPGASADTLSKTVAAPLEEKINGAKNMLYINSTSQDSGRLSINVYFKVGTNPEDAKIDVNNRVQSALSKLPEEVKRQGVNVSESSPSMLQVIMLYSENKNYDLTYLTNYNLLNIVDDLKRVKGVGEVTVFGTKDYSMRIWIDPIKLSKYSLTVSDIVNSIKEQNNQYSSGKISQEPIESKQMFTYTIQTKERLSNPVEFGNIIIKSFDDGKLLRLNQVANIELGAANYDMVTKLNGKEASPIGIFLKSDANAIETAKEVNNVLEKSSLNFPEGISYKIPYDSTDFVKISIKEVMKTFVEAILLVIFIIYLFLQNWRATLIPLIAVPVSIIGTFTGMYLLGFSINLLTLFGLVLAIGIVVDDAIIVIENVERHLKEGMTPKNASFKAMQEVSSALISIILVLSAVFIPVAFIGGLTGEMYKQFAITIVISIVISGFVALTLTPALCSVFLKNDHKEHTGFFKYFNYYFEKLTNSYSFIVSKSIKYFIITILLFCGLIFISYDMFKNMKTSLVPQEDQGTIFLFSFNPPGSSLSRTNELANELNSFLTKNENIKDIITLSGLDFTTFSSRTNSVASIIKLNHWDERTKPEQSANQILKDINQKSMMTSDGFSIGVLPPSIMGMSISGGFEMYIQNKSGESTLELSKYINEIIEKAKLRKELMGVRTTLTTNIPQYKMEVDIEKAKIKGVNLFDIYSTINATFGTYYVNDFLLYGRTYQVTLQAEQKYRDNIEDLKDISVKDKEGNLIPISSFVKFNKVVGTDLVERFNLFPSGKISGMANIGYSSGDALKAIEEVSNEVLPKGYGISWVGTAYQEKQVSSSSFITMSFGLILLYLILAAQYGKWILPIVVLLAVPFAVFGAILATNLRGLENDIYFQIGLLVLAGLAAKNAILIVEFALQKEKEGKNKIESAIEATKIRLRPIIMTSLAFTLGVIPLAISSGAGAASRHSIGTGVIGGMIIATFIAIIFIPTFYVLISKKIIKNKED